MNELKEKLELEDKDFLVATILDLQNMIDDQRRRLIHKDESVQRFLDSNTIYEDTLKEVRTAILDIIRGIATETMGRAAILYNLEQLKDAI